MPDFALLFVSNVRHLHFKDVCMNSERVSEKQKEIYLSYLKATAPVYSNMANYRANRLIPLQAAQTARNLKEQHSEYLVLNYDRKSRKTFSVSPSLTIP